MAHRLRFEERSGCDPHIIGRRIYSLDEHPLGVATANYRTPKGACLIIVDVAGDPNISPVVIEAARVLVEAPRQTPHLDGVEDEAPPLPPWDPNDPPPQGSMEGLDLRGKSGWTIYSSPERERAANRVFEEAGLAAREEGVAEGENALPLENEPDPPPNQLRPTGPVLDEEGRPTDTSIHPRGKPFGRKWEDPDATPPTGMPVIQGGSTMASVGEVKAAIDAAMQTADEAAASVRVGIEKLNEAQQQLGVALEGGHHDAVTTAIQALAHANQQFEEGIQAIMGSKEAAQGYGGAL